MHTEALESLKYAEDVLNGSIPVGGDPARVAAFIARRAVETLIEGYCNTAYAHLLPSPAAQPWPALKWASKIALIRAQDDDYGAALIYAWIHLTSCCHEHAYELAPTTDEVRNICRSVVDQIALDRFHIV